jgi:hypothetical protein
MQIRLNYCSGGSILRPKRHLHTVERAPKTAPLDLDLKTDGNPQKRPYF